MADVFTDKAPPPRQTELQHQPNALIALAARCETAPRPDRALDADIYEALGYTVRRKPTALRARRVPAGGIYREGTIWKTLGTVSADIDAAARLLRERAPDWSWSLRCTLGEESGTFQALVAECAGSGMLGSLALCAALLRALAKRGRAADPDASRKGDPSSRQDG